MNSIDTRPHRPLAPHLAMRYVLLCAAVGTPLGAYRAAAQDYHAADSTSSTAIQESLDVDDSARLRLSVQVSPHVLHFDPRTQSATLEFRNVENHPKTAHVLVQFAYLDHRHGLPADTIVIATQMDAVQPHDTVITTPGPKDHDAARWLSGVPTEVKLAPHETKRVTIHLIPPAHLPDGEYWARIETRVTPPARRGHSQDTEKKYNLPTRHHAPVVQDSCHVVYRQGAVHMGLALDSTKAVARIDVNEIGDVDRGTMGPHALWIRFPVRVTGNAPFQGQMHTAFHNVATGEVVQPNTAEYAIYKDGIEHWAIETNTMTPGQWVLDISFDNERTDIPVEQRLPMRPATISIPFELPAAWAH